MGKLFETIVKLEGNETTIQNRTYGVIEVTKGTLTGIHFRPWPKLISSIEATWMGGWQHRRNKKNQCLVYYNQPWSSPRYLALPYLQTSFSTTYKTIFQALVILDQVARIKKSDALLADVTNPRLTDRIMMRMGWEQHLQHKQRRHFIKRFYGTYPQTVKNTAYHDCV